MFKGAADMGWVLVQRKEAGEKLVRGGTTYAFIVVVLLLAELDS